MPRLLCRVTAGHAPLEGEGSGQHGLREPEVAGILVAVGQPAPLDPGAQVVERDTPVVTHPRQEGNAAIRLGPRQQLPRKRHGKDRVPQPQGDEPEEAEVLGRARNASADPPRGTPRKTARVTLEAPGALTAAAIAPETAGQPRLRTASRPPKRR